MTNSVDKQLQRMSLPDKAGQVLMPGFDGTSLTDSLRALVADLRLGGVILFEHNVSTVAGTAALIRDLQAAAATEGLPGLFVSVDQEGGHVTRLRRANGFSEFPSPREVAACGGPQAAAAVACGLAADLQRVGFNMDLAPVLDVDSNPSNPIINNRSFSSDPQQVAACGVAFIEALQTAGIMAVGKHFPGHGDTSLDSHVALPTVTADRARLDAVELAPFRAALTAGVSGIMSAHVVYTALDPRPDRPATVSPAILSGLLRQELGFDGLILTDSLDMGALAAAGYPIPEAAVAALAAGADVLLFNCAEDLVRRAHTRIVDGVARGAIPMARLDDAVRRILRTKQQYGVQVDR